MQSVPAFRHENWLVSLGCADFGAAFDSALSPIPQEHAEKALYG
jgi:hypothetical protein